MCPAASKSQQRFMGMVHAKQKGDLPNASPEVKKVAKTIKKKDATDFASTKHKGLPDKVQEGTATLKIKKTAYRGKDGFLIYGKDSAGRATRIFATTMASAKHIKAKKERGEDIEVKDFDEGIMKEDQIKGGLADKETSESIAKKHGVSVQHIEGQITIGLKIEKEHTSDPALAREISLDHLEEDPDYYTKLSAMEKKTAQEKKKNESVLRQHIRTEIRRIIGE